MAAPISRFLPSTSTDEREEFSFSYNLTIFCCCQVNIPRALIHFFQTPHLHDTILREYLCFCHLFLCSKTFIWSGSVIHRLNVIFNRCEPQQHGPFPIKPHRVLPLWPQIQLPFHHHGSSLRICLAAGGFTSWWHSKTEIALCCCFPELQSTLACVHNSWMSCDPAIVDNKVIARLFLQWNSFPGIHGTVPRISSSWEVKPPCSGRCY